MITSFKTTPCYVVHPTLCTLPRMYIHSTLCMSFCMHVSTVCMSLPCVCPSVGMSLHASCMTPPCVCRLRVYVPLYVCFLRCPSPPCLWSHWVCCILCRVYTRRCVRCSVCMYVPPCLCPTVCILHDIYT